MIWSIDSSNHAERNHIDSMLFPVNDGNDTRSIIVTNEHGFIVGVSRHWVRMCGFEAEDVFGQTPRILQGPATDHNAARNFTSELRINASAQVVLINYKKNKSAFRHDLRGWQYGDLLVVETVNEKELPMHKDNDQETLQEN